MKSRSIDYFQPIFRRLIESFEALPTGFRCHRKLSICTTRLQTDAVQTTTFKLTKSSKQFCFNYILSRIERDFCYKGLIRLSPVLGNTGKNLEIIRCNES